MAAVGVTRTVTAMTLRREAARADDAKVTRRALAIAMALDGRSRSEAAEASAMDRQTLRDWVHRFNAAGLEGLSDRSHPGRRRRCRPSSSRNWPGGWEAGSRTWRRMAW